MKNQKVQVLMCVKYKY